MSQSKKGAICKCCNLLKPWVTDGECKECYNKNRGIIKINTKCIICHEKVRNLYDGKCWQCDQKSWPTFADIQNKRMKDENLQKCIQCKEEISKNPICYFCEKKNKRSRDISLLLNKDIEA